MQEILPLPADNSLPVPETRDTRANRRSGPDFSTLLREEKELNSSLPRPPSQVRPRFGQNGIRPAKGTQPERTSERVIQHPEHKVEAKQDKKEKEDPSNQIAVPCQEQLCQAQTAASSGGTVGSQSTQTEKVDGTATDNGSKPAVDSSEAVQSQSGKADASANGMVAAIGFDLQGGEIQQVDAAGVDAGGAIVSGTNASGTNAGGTNASDANVSVTSAGGKSTDSAGSGGTNAGVINAGGLNAEGHNDGLDLEALKRSSAGSGRVPGLVTDADHGNTTKAQVVSDPNQPATQVNAPQGKPVSLNLADSGAQGIDLQTGMKDGAGDAGGKQADSQSPSTGQPGSNSLAANLGSYQGVGPASSQPVISGNELARTAEAHSAELLNQVSLEIAKGVKANNSSIQIHLNPEELGKIDLRLTSGVEGLRVVIKAEYPESGQLLERNLQQLRHSLQEAGVQLSDVSVNQNGGQSHQDWTQRSPSTRRIDLQPDNQGKEPAPDTIRQPRKRFDTNSSLDYLI